MKNEYFQNNSKHFYFYRIDYSYVIVGGYIQFFPVGITRPIPNDEVKQFFFGAKWLFIKPLQRKPRPLRRR